MTNSTPPGTNGLGVYGRGLALSTCVLAARDHISATVDGLSERSVSPVPYPSTSAPRPGAGPRTERTRYCKQAFWIIASRTALQSPGRPLPAASVSAFCTADSPRGQLSLAIDVQRSPTCRRPCRVGTARTMPSPRRVRAVSTPGMRVTTVGTSATDCDSRSGSDDNSSIATIRTRRSGSGQHRRLQDHAAPIWEKPSASRTLDTPLREEPRDSARFRTTVGCHPDRHDIDIAVGILVGLLSATPKRGAFEELVRAVHHTGGGIASVARSLSPSPAADTATAHRPRPTRRRHCRSGNALHNGSRPARTSTLIAARAS